VSSSLAALAKRSTCARTRVIDVPLHDLVEAPEDLLGVREAAHRDPVKLSIHVHARSVQLLEDPGDAFGALDHELPRSSSS